ncbi:MAG TPA: ornithine carbamoyltransferase [Nocardioidaceae bacterium]
MKDVLRIADLSPDDLRHGIGLALAAKRRPREWGSLLDGETAVLCFAMPATRSRILFESAVARLGGTPVVLGPTELQLGRDDSLEDAAKDISRFARAIVIRGFDDKDLRRFAAAATAPVINASSAGHHPCQALTDLMTLREHFGRLSGLKVAYLGAGNNVAHSLIEACALAGIDIAVATPPGFGPSVEVLDHADQVARVSGSIVWPTHDPLVAVAGANAVYTGPWSSMNTSEQERELRVAALRPYEVTSAVMAEADPGAVFLHCLRTRRGEEVSPAVIDGPQALVVEQAENRLHAAVGLLAGLLKEELAGATAGSREPQPA